jgi:hypothetical protein
MENCKLFGVLNVFNTTPDFIMLVYSDGRELYFRDNIDITEFKPVPIILKHKIVPLVNIPKKAAECEKLFAFQFDTNDVFIGNFEDMKEFFKNFDTGDKILDEKIQLFYRKNQ